MSNKQDSLFEFGFNYKSTTASGLISDKGKFVADLAGEYVINASFGSTSSSIQVRAIDRDIKKEIVKLGLGEVFDRRTSDAWFFEGTDGKDYGVSGTWGSDGTAYFWDVTDPTDIKKIDSVQVDARIVNLESTLAEIEEEKGALQLKLVELEDIAGIVRLIVIQSQVLAIN